MLRLLAPALLLVLAACGGEPVGSAVLSPDSAGHGEAGCAADPRGQVPTHCADTGGQPGDSPPPGEPRPALHFLEIEQRYEPGPSGVLYVEGARTEVLVTGADGGTQALQGDESARLTVSLPAGTYVVEPALRPCSANCVQGMGERTDACTLTIDVPATQRLRVRHVVGQHCTVEAG